MLVRSECRLGGMLQLTIIALEEPRTTDGGRRSLLHSYHREHEVDDDNDDDMYLVQARTMVPRAITRDIFKFAEMHRTFAFVRTDRLQAWVYQAESDAKQRIEALIAQRFG